MVDLELHEILELLDIHGLKTQSQGRLNLNKAHGLAIRLGFLGAKITVQHNLKWTYYTYCMKIDRYINRYKLKLY